MAFVHFLRHKHVMPFRSEIRLLLKVIGMTALPRHTVGCTTNAARTELSLFKLPSHKTKGVPGHSKTRLQHSYTILLSGACL